MVDDLLVKIIKPWGFIIAARLSCVGFHESGTIEIDRLECRIRSRADVDPSSMPQ